MSRLRWPSEEQGAAEEGQLKYPLQIQVIRQSLYPSTKWQTRNELERGLLHNIWTVEPKTRSLGAALQAHTVVGRDAGIHLMP